MSGIKDLRPALGMYVLADQLKVSLKTFKPKAHNETQVVKALKDLTKQRLTLQTEKRFFISMKTILKAFEGLLLHNTLIDRLHLQSTRIQFKYYETQYPASRSDSEAFFQFPGNVNKPKDLCDLLCSLVTTHLNYYFNAKQDWKNQQHHESIISTYYRNNAKLLGVQYVEDINTPLDQLYHHNNVEAKYGSPPTDISVEKHKEFMEYLLSELPQSFTTSIDRNFKKDKNDNFTTVFIEKYCSLFFAYRQKRIKDDYVNYCKEENCCNWLIRYTETVLYEDMCSSDHHKEYRSKSKNRDYARLLAETLVIVKRSYLDPLFTDELSSDQLHVISDRFKMLYIRTLCQAPGNAYDMKLFKDEYRHPTPANPPLLTDVDNMTLYRQADQALYVAMRSLGYLRASALRIIGLISHLVFISYINKQYRKVKPSSFQLNPPLWWSSITKKCNTSMGNCKITSKQLIFYIKQGVLDAAYWYMFYLSSNKYWYLGENSLIEEFKQKFGGLLDGKPDIFKITKGEVCILKRKRNFLSLPIGESEKKNLEQNGGVKLLDGGVDRFKEDPGVIVSLEITKKKYIKDLIEHGYLVKKEVPAHSHYKIEFTEAAKQLTTVYEWQGVVNKILLRCLKQMRIKSELLKRMLGNYFLNRCGSYIETVDGCYGWYPKKIGHIIWIPNLSSDALNNNN